jgi:hypothetical protein
VQCDLLTYDAYERFLDKRAALISAAVNRLLSVLA